jgi:hypothetical protein
MTLDTIDRAAKRAHFSTTWDGEGGLELRAPGCTLHATQDGRIRLLGQVGVAGDLRVRRLYKELVR